MLHKLCVLFFSVVICFVFSQHVFFFFVKVRSTGKIEGMVRYNDAKVEQGGSMVGDVQQGIK